MDYQNYMAARNSYTNDLAAVQQTAENKRATAFEKWEDKSEALRSARTTALQQGQEEATKGFHILESGEGAAAGGAAMVHGAGKFLLGKVKSGLETEYKSFQDDPEGYLGSEGDSWAGNKMRSFLRNKLGRVKNALSGGGSSKTNEEKTPFEDDDIEGGGGESSIMEDTKGLYSKFKARFLGGSDADKPAVAFEEDEGTELPGWGESKGGSSKTAEPEDEDMEGRPPAGPEDDIGESGGGGEELEMQRMGGSKLQEPEGTPEEPDDIEMSRMGGASKTDDGGLAEKDDDGGLAMKDDEAPGTFDDTIEADTDFDLGPHIQGSGGGGASKTAEPEDEEEEDDYGSEWGDEDWEAGDEGGASKGADAGDEGLEAGEEAGDIAGEAAGEAATEGAVEAAAGALSWIPFVGEVAMAIGGAVAAGVGIADAVSGGAKEGLAEKMPSAAQAPNLPHGINLAGKVVVPVADSSDPHVSGSF